MNIVDMIIIAIVCLGMIRGIFRGLSSELASIIGIFAGFYGAYLFHPRLAAFFPQAVPDCPAHIAAFAVIFCGVLVLVGLLGKLIRFVLGITLLGWLDRLLGAGFGAAKGALLAGVVLFAMTHFYQAAPATVERSFLGRYVDVASDAMADVVSSRWHIHLKSKAEELRKQWEFHG